MIDKTTLGLTAEPAEVEAVLHNLCGYHLAERDPVFRYTVLTREQVLYDALVATIKRERGRALAEIADSGRSLAQIAQMTNLGTRQRVQRLIALAKEVEQAVAEAAVAEVQAASRDFEERLAAVEATLDEVVGGGTTPTGEVIPADDSTGLVSVAAFGSGSYELVGSAVSSTAGPPVAFGGAGSIAPAGFVGTPVSSEDMFDFANGPRQPTGSIFFGDGESREAGVLEPTQMLPALAAALHPTKELPSQDEDLPWWRKGRDNGIT
jgi:hypothetical protein